MASKYLLTLCALAALVVGALYLQRSSTPVPAELEAEPVQSPAVPEPLALSNPVEEEPSDIPARGIASSAAPTETSFVLTGPEPQLEHTVRQARIAIIIDDLGDQWSAGKQAIELPGQVTLALLPFTPHGRQLAILARQQGKELMLHAPMEPQVHRSWEQGLDTQMDEATLRHELRRMLEYLPEAKGANNHMGSALTENSAAMGWVMDELARRGLYFVDSRTTALSTALVQARQLSLPSAKRDVFLDNTRSPEAIAQQFEKLLLTARQQGSAIAIGHPYPETLAFLQGALQNLRNTGVELVPVSQLLSATSAPENDAFHADPIQERVPLQPPTIPSS